MDSRWRSMFVERTAVVRSSCVGNCSPQDIAASHEQRAAAFRSSNMVDTRNRGCRASFLPPLVLCNLEEFTNEIALDHLSICVIERVRGRRKRRGRGDIRRSLYRRNRVSLDAVRYGRIGPSQSGVARGSSQLRDPVNFTDPNGLSRLDSYLQLGSVELIERLN